MPSQQTLDHKLLRMISVRVNNITGAIKDLERVKESYKENFPGKGFIAFQVVDSDDLRQLMILLAFDSFEDMGNSIKINSLIMDSLFKNTNLISVTSETLLFQKEMTINESTQPGR